MLSEHSGVKNFLFALLKVNKKTIPSDPAVIGVVQLEVPGKADYHLSKWYVIDTSS